MEHDDQGDAGDGSKHAHILPRNSGRINTYAGMELARPAFGTSTAIACAWSAHTGNLSEDGRLQMTTVRAWLDNFRRVTSAICHLLKPVCI
jgi:hypothetical protein